jgi:hypothetical protein
MGAVLLLHMPKKPVVSSGPIEPRNEELIDLVKKYMFLEFNDEAIINTILTMTGNVITREQLLRLKETAKREKKESRIEIEIYLQQMMEVGIFEEVERQFETSKMMLITNTQTFSRVAAEGDVNKQIALTNVITRQMEDMRKIVTSMGWLAKSKEILERGFKNGGLDNSNGTSITIQTKPNSSFSEAIDQSIGEAELRDNEVF